MSVLTSAAPRLEIEYPESDGKPMAETDIHIRELTNTRATLADFFREASDVYVSGNLLLYYEEGNPAASVSPDVFVVKGVPKGERRTYRVWVEKRPPLVVFEFTSRSTRLEDSGNKKALYAMLGVSEYFLCDPLSEYLQPPMQGFTLERGDYRRLPEESDGTVISRELGLRLKMEGSQLRLVVIATGEQLLTPAEAQEKARAEAKARQAAEAEIERLKAELARLRGEQ
ncbi:MAG TPA: Uma2 family endonuclease [Anaerolineales bacterium]|nr:Uma2 family endonuclease [Anaerolineales bacterium]